MTSKISTVLLLAVLAVLALIVYARFVDAPAHTDPAIPIPYTSKEGTPMLTASAEKRSTSVAIPPIDLAAPKKTETATFALG